jgi:hypothetical protein
VGQLDKANQIAALATSVTVEEIFAGVDIERRPGFRMLGAPYLHAFRFPRGPGRSPAPLRERPTSSLGAVQGGPVTAARFRSSLAAKWQTLRQNRGFSSAYFSGAQAKLVASLVSPVPL